jgi:prepilin-type N-terminal cleavage/methylation domain-containing protein
MRTSTTINRNYSGYKHSGFTIIELMVVVVVIVLLATVMGRYYVGTYKRMLVEKGAKEIMLAAKYARLFAVEKQSRCRLVLDESQQGYCLMSKDVSEYSGEMDEVMIANAYTKPGQLKGEVVFEKVEIASMVRINTSAQEGQSIVAFRPDGTADKAVIQVGDGRNHYTVYISPATGKAEVKFGIANESGIDIVDLDVEAY